MAPRADGDLAVANRLVSGAVGRSLVQLSVGAANLDLSLTGQEPDAGFQLEGQVIFDPGSGLELRCEPYSIAALERLLPVLNHELVAASVQEAGSLRLSLGGVTFQVEPSDRCDSWFYGGPSVAGDVTMSEGCIYCTAGGRLDIFTET
ncbi:DUF6188 family protein [Actinopolymorpha sp. B9G3]|uniref:DUF6188 family protein n=1 Tax=Actinopolymorpha sp. B9G3 TaxID=3158970 RepID=UPI0032D9124C